MRDPSSRPNLVFVLVDDQRHDLLGCAQHPIVQTPHIDRLAAEGVRFSHALVTTSICWVSRSTLLTGMWSRSHGSRDNIHQVSAAAATMT
ncbi:MAG: sulfatase-like hydrolase/transferase, partial [Planctomycetota bacterium]